MGAFAVSLRVVHVNHREHGGCANDVVDGPLPVRELPPPRGDEQVQHLHNEKLAPQGHPASPVPPWPRTRLVAVRRLTLQTARW